MNTLFITLTLLGNSILPFNQIFNSDYYDAVEFVKCHKHTLNGIETERVKASLFISIVFPELIRYTTIRDFFETTTLEMVYIKKGSSVVDFSIGYFQMKPSFAKKIEEQISRNPSIYSNHQEICIPEFIPGSNQRKIRIERLKQLEWQLQYLDAFIAIVYKRFPMLKTRSEVYQLRFLATAYNYNFMKTVHDIEKWMSIKAYPDGMNSWSTQYSYCDVAQFFYQNDAKEIFNQ